MSKSRDIFLNGTKDVKISFFIMGFSNFAKKQFVHGTLFLAAQIIFLYYFFSAGIHNLKNLITLGTNAQGWVFDEARGINVRVEGDNSMVILINGIMALLIILGFVFLYRIQLHYAWKLQTMIVAGKKIPSIKEELKMLFDSKFHITLLTIPSIGVAAFTVLPLIFMILIAFTNYDSAHQPPGNLFTWVGFENFKNLLGSNPKQAATLLPILQWTLIWAVMATVTCYFFGTIVACMINKKTIKLKKFWRTIFVITIAVPQFVSLLVMRNMLNEYGPINELLLQWGWIQDRIPFLTNSLLAKISVIVVNMWVGIPYAMLITTGVLISIPEEQYESAKIDGANPITIFFKITVPHLIFVMAPHLITSFIGNINNFSVIYLLTDGGPESTAYYQAGKTDLMVTWLYKLTVDRRDYNLASTIGIIVFMVSIVLALSTFRMTPSYRKEDDFS